MTTCGKCGSQIDRPGPCPVCSDRPFGRATCDVKMFDKPFSDAEARAIAKHVESLPVLARDHERRWLERDRVMRQAQRDLLALAAMYRDENEALKRELRKAIGDKCKAESRASDLISAVEKAIRSFRSQITETLAKRQQEADTG